MHNAMHMPSVRGMALDCGWCAGLLILLLQLAGDFLPAGEARDWVYFYGVGGWAGLVIASAFAGRFMRWPVSHGAAVVIKIAASIYAFAMLSFYFDTALASVWFVWVWALAGAAAYAWVRRQPVAGRRRLEAWAAMAWFLLTVLGMGGTLVYKSPLLGLAADKNALQYAVAFAVLLLVAGPFIYAALRRADGGAGTQALKPPYAAGLLMLALYALVFVAFREDGLNERWAVYHWRAYTEPAAELREGGWLLWDVPSLYGFLQTLLVAFLPAANTWQSLYLVNAALVTAAGGMIFFALFARYRSLAGFAGCLLVALSCTAMNLQTTPDPRIMPDTGALRFIWVYAVAGYVLHLCRYHARMSALPRHAFLRGNALWLLGCLWSVESALFVTILWIPSPKLAALAQAMSAQPQPTPKEAMLHIAKKAWVPFALAALAVLAVTAYYLAELGHSPDFSLMTAYIRAYAFSFTTMPIERLGCAPAWLLAFFLFTMMARFHVAHAAITAQSVLNAAVLYCAVAGLWAVCSYYIPFSEDFHLAATLPVMVYLSAALLLVLPLLDLPVAIKASYEKAAVSLYSILALALAAHMNPGGFAAQSWLSPVHSDIYERLPEPPAALRELVEKAHIPDHAHVQVISMPFVPKGDKRYLERVEGYFFRDRHWRQWLLPNTLVGYEGPLPAGLYQEIAQRRAARLTEKEGWVIETDEHGMGEYPWLGNAAAVSYAPDAVREQDGFRVRRFIRREKSGQ